VKIAVNIVSLLWHRRRECFVSLKRCHPEPAPAQGEGGTEACSSGRKITLHTIEGKHACTSSTTMHGNRKLHGPSQGSCTVASPCRFEHRPSPGHAHWSFRGVHACADVQKCLNHRCGPSPRMCAIHAQMRANSCSRTHGAPADFNESENSEQT
jgi:hypothetical protein